MFIQIAPRVKVYVSVDDLHFINTHSQGSFRASQLPAEDVDRVKKLADKAIFVKKKLDTDMQYALNRRIRFVNNAKKK